MSMLSCLIIGGLLGWLTKVIMRPSARSVMVQNIIIGSVSALLSGFLARALGLYGPGDVASIVFVLLGTIIILNRSTRDSYTRCHGHPGIARLRVLPVCQCCVA